MLVELIKTDKTEERFGYIDNVIHSVGEVFEAKELESAFTDNNEMFYDKNDIEIVKEMNALQELERFQTDRLLHKNPFNLRIATMNILEELLEAHGVGDNKERELVDMLYEDLLDIVTTTIKFHNENGDMSGCTYSEPTIEDQVDAFCDIQVFAGGEIGKLGYSNEQCLIEVGKEINSRTGEIVNGKFEKYKTEEAMAKWYKADFSGCKLNVE